jgi:hypothetical protein
MFPNSDTVELTIGHFQQVDSEAMGCYAHDRPILCAVTEATIAQGAQVLEALALQLMAAHPPGASQVVLFEPQATLHFGELKRLLAATQGELGRQWITPGEAKTELETLNKRVIERASLLAAARQPSLAAYNAGRRTPEPVYWVLLSGLGALALHDAMLLHTLRHIAEQGPRCGVVLLVLHDLDATRAVPLSQTQHQNLYDMLGAMAPNAFGFDFSDAAKPMPYNMGEPYQRFIADFCFTPEFTPEKLQEYAEEILSARRAREKENPHQDFLRVKVGEAKGLPAYFALGHASDVFNAMISGSSGSGKTTFVQNLILSICEQYTPAQIELTLLDYGTVSFGPYRNVAHVQTVFNTPRDGQRLARLFEWLEGELQRRLDAIDACGRQHNRSVDNLATYQRLSGVALPIELLVIDEFGSLMSNDNTSMTVVKGRQMRVNAHAEYVIDRLAREGRKAGMHVMVVTQSFANIDRLPKELKTNPHLKVGLKAEQVRDSTALLSNDNDAAYRLARFQAVFNKQRGQIAGNIIVDLDYVNEDAIAERQTALRARWPRTQPSPLAVFMDAQMEPGGDAAPDARQVRSAPPGGPEWLRR